MMGRDRRQGSGGGFQGRRRAVGASAAQGKAMQSRLSRAVGSFTCVFIVLSGVSVAVGPASRADPSDYARPPVPLPVITPTPSDWVPKFPFPFDQTKNRVTDADINAEREMCQWFNAQYDELMRQINWLQFNRITPNGPGVYMGSGSDWDYSIGDLQQQVDIVTTNIDQSVGFLAPRAQALTQSTDHAGNVYFPIYQGESFYLLWQHLSNVNAGIKSHQAAWFTGPSVHRVLRWGSRIHRSNVCE